MIEDLHSLVQSRSVVQMGEIANCVFGQVYDSLSLRRMSHDACGAMQHGRIKPGSNLALLDHHCQAPEQYVWLTYLVEAEICPYP